MEQHQIPRNITGFQFHLIGDMTLKQFGYLSVGIITAFIIYKYSPFPSVINIAIAGLVGFTGFATAFIPIQERPLDKWLVAFFKSIISPTQYLWQKEGTLPDFFYMNTTGYVKPLTQQQSDNHNYAKEKLHSYLATIPITPHHNLNIQEKKYIDKTLSLFNTTSSINPSPSIKYPPRTILPNTVNSVTSVNMHMPTALKVNVQPETSKPQPISQAKTVNTTANINIQSEGLKLQPIIQTKPVSTATNSINIQSETFKSHPISHPKIEENKEMLSKINSAIRANPDQNPQDAIRIKTQTVENNSQDPDLLKKFEALAREKDQLAKQLEMLKNEMKKTESAPVIQQKNNDQASKPNIKTIPYHPSNPPGISNLSQTPNIVVGIIKDSDQKLIPNIIITIKDNKGMPLRAIKTNKLGQFETATPLPNGTYILEIEDPLKRYVFDGLQITLSGKILQMVEIIAKGQKEIMREKLSKELFGNAIM